MSQACETRQWERWGALSPSAFTFVVTLFADIQDGQLDELQSWW